MTFICNSDVDWMRVVEMDLLSLTTSFSAATQACKNEASAARFSSSVPAYQNEW
jgi:hypothetical protein